MDRLLKDITIGKWKIPFPVLLWFALAAIGAIIELIRGPRSMNNYFIYEYVFRHTLNQQNLYLLYPGEHHDCNHYGPVFSLVIAPFALMPTYIGCFLWCMANGFLLFFAIKKLPVSDRSKNIILLVGAVEMMTSMQNLQFNPMLTAWIILSYVMVKKEKDFWAAFFIVMGLLVKLYGIVGLIFFLFSKHRLKFIASFVFWLVLLFCLPMLISTPAFIIQSYYDWYHALVEKNSSNVNFGHESNMQDISVMGMIRRIFHYPALNDLVVLLPAAILIALPALRISKYKNTVFQLFYLSVALISIVIFSSSAESPTYVIAITGVAIWYVSHGEPSPKWVIALLTFAIVLTSLSTTDLFPRSVKRAYFIGYSLKALPCFTVWLVLIYQLLFTRNVFAKQNAL